MAIAGRRPPLTIAHLMGLVAYCAVASAVLASLARTLKPWDFWPVSVLLLGSVPLALRLIVWSFERPGPGRTRHLILCVALTRLSIASIYAATAVWIWVVMPAADLPLFLRHTGVYTLLLLGSIPFAVRSLPKIARAAGILLRKRLREENDHKALHSAAWRLVALAVIVAFALGLSEIERNLWDLDLFNLARAFLTAWFAWKIVGLRPSRCPACRRPMLLAVPRKPPFTEIGERAEPAWCLACGTKCRRAPGSPWKVRVDVTEPHPTWTTPATGHALEIEPSLGHIQH